MTRTFERFEYNRDTQKNEYTHTYTIAVYPGNNNVITVSRDSQHKTVKVVECCDFVYSLQKTQIKAINGANGLFKYIDKCLTENFCECLAYRILDHVIDNMREAKI